MSSYVGADVFKICRARKKIWSCNRETDAVPRTLYVASYTPLFRLPYSEHLDKTGSLTYLMN